MIKLFCEWITEDQDRVLEERQVMLETVMMELLVWWEVELMQVESTASVGTSISLGTVLFTL